MSSLRPLNSHTSLGTSYKSAGATRLHRESSLLQSINNVNFEFAERLSKLSSLLSSVMMEDLDSLIVQALQVYHSYYRHITQELGLIGSKMDQIRSVGQHIGKSVAMAQKINNDDIGRIRDETDAYSCNRGTAPSSTSTLHFTHWQ